MATTPSGGLHTASECWFPRLALSRRAESASRVDKRPLRAVVEDGNLYVRSTSTINRRKKAGRVLESRSILGGAAVCKFLQVSGGHQFPNIPALHNPVVCYIYFSTVAGAPLASRRLELEYFQQRFRAKQWSKLKTVAQWCLSIVM